MKSFFQILFLTLLLASAGFSQPSKRGGIAGYVVDSESSEPLIGANVVITGKETGAATNKFGYFVIPHLQPGVYRLQVSYIGYQTQKLEVTVVAGAFGEITVRLKPQTLQMEGVEVTADYYNEEEKNISTISMPITRLRDIPAVGESDLLRAIQLLPGVQAVNELSSGLYIRGGSPDQNLILLDDITVYNPSHFFGFFSTFNPDAIKDIKLIKGGYPAEYGGRLSAVLDVTNKDGNRQHFSSQGAVSLISSKLLLEGPLPRGSYMISGRRTYLDILLALSGIKDLPNYYFYDVNAKVNFDLGRRDRLIFSTYFGRDILHFERKEQGISTGNIHIGWGNRVLSGKWIHFFNPKLYGSFVLAGSHFESIIHADASGFPVRFDNRIRDYSMKANMEWLGLPGHFVKFGLWLTNYRFYNSIQIGENTGFENLIIKHPYYGALYIQDEWRPNPLWRITGGLRLNAFSDGAHIQLDPRLQVRRQLTDALAIIGSAGSYTQYTTVVVNDVASFADLWYPIDNTINPLRSQQFILGFDWRNRRGLSLNVEFYHKPMQNVVEFRQRQDTRRDKLNEIFYIGNGLARGVEIFLQKRQGRFTGWLGYTWSKTTRRFAELNHGEDFPAKWDFTHDFVAILAIKLGKKWQLGTTLIFKSGPTFTVPSGKYRLGPPDFPIDYVRAGKKNSARLAPYHRMDVFLSRNWQMFGVKGAFNFSIFNVYNHRNVWYRDYNFEKLNEPPEITDIKLLPILPTVEIKFEF